MLQTELACVTHGGAECGEGLGLAGSGLLSLTGTDIQLVAILFLSSFETLVTLISQGHAIFKCEP